MSTPHKDCCRCSIGFLSNIPNSGNIPVYRSALMENSHQTQGGKFGANPALSRNCNEIIASLSQDARRFVYLLFFICEVWMMVSLLFF